MAADKPTRVLGIVGSPRRGGNTDIMVDHILAGARDAGAKVEKVMLADLKIAPCEACYECDTGGICVQDDDMKRVFERMAASPVWVLGTPVYWWGPSAQMKAFVDRWFSKAPNRDDSGILVGKKVVLAIPLGDTDPATARHVVGMFEDALEYLNSEVVELVLAPGAYAIGDVKKQPELLKRARAAGERAVLGK